MLFIEKQTITHSFILFIRKQKLSGKELIKVLY